MSDGAPTVDRDAPSGATMRPQYMGRTMKCYPVHESEMDMLATLNTQATAFFSAAAASAGYAISIWVNAAFAEKLTPTARMASAGIAPVMMVVGLVFVALAIHASIKRHGLWGRIQAESAAVFETLTRP